MQHAQSQQRGHRAAAGRAARRVVRIPRIAGDAGQRTVANANPAVLGHAGLAEDDRALLAQARDRRRIGLRRRGVAGSRAAPRGQGLGPDIVLDRDRYAVDWPEWIARPPTRLRLGGSLQGGVQIQDGEGVDRGVALDAGETIARHVDRREPAAPVGRRQIGAGQLGYGAHRGTSDPTQVSGAKAPAHLSLGARRR